MSSNDFHLVDFHSSAGTATTRRSLLGSTTNSAAEITAAAVTVASYARDADDARVILAALGLNPDTQETDQ